MNPDACIHLVNYDECSLSHCTCNGCMECKDYKPGGEVNENTDQ